MPNGRAQTTRSTDQITMDISAIETALTQLKTDLESKKLTSSSTSTGENEMKVYWAESADVTEPTMIVYIPIAETSRSAQTAAKKK